MAKLLIVVERTALAFFLNIWNVYTLFADELLQSQTLAKVNCFLSLSGWTAMFLFTNHTGETWQRQWCADWRCWSESQQRLRTVSQHVRRRNQGLWSSSRPNLLHTVPKCLLWLKHQGKSRRPGKAKHLQHWGPTLIRARKIFSVLLAKVEVNGKF